MLGISALVSGDFVFLPDDYKIRKVAPETWIGNGSAKKKFIKKTSQNEEASSQFTLFLRIKFFMPANLSKTVKYVLKFVLIYIFMIFEHEFMYIYRGGSWRHWIYLQLRRSVVEGQMILRTPQLINLAGYALQAEFGNYSPKVHLYLKKIHVYFQIININCYFQEHSSGDYYLLEHYLPEGSYCENDKEIRSQIKQVCIL